MKDKQHAKLAKDRVALLDARLAEPRWDKLRPHIDHYQANINCVNPLKSFDILDDIADFLGFERVSSKRVAERKEHRRKLKRFLKKFVEGKNLVPLRCFLLLFVLEILQYLAQSDIDIACVVRIRHGSPQNENCLEDRIYIEFDVLSFPGLLVLN